MSMGCTVTPATKIARSPLVFMDLVSDGGNATTKIYVRSSSDHRFDLLSIRIDDSGIADSDCMLLYHNTTMRAFNLTVLAVDPHTVYSLEAHVDVIPTQLKAFDIDLEGDVEHVDLDELPWVHRMEGT